MSAFTGQLLQSVVSALLMGMVFALVALGLTIIFGVMNIVNFAHGEFLMVGMYAGLLFANLSGLDTLASLPIAGIVGFVLGVICYYGLVKFLLRGPVCVHFRACVAPGKGVFIEIVIHIASPVVHRRLACAHIRLII